MAFQINSSAVLALLYEQAKLRTENAELLAALKAVLSHPHGQPRNDALHRDLKAARAAIAKAKGGEG